MRNDFTIKPSLIMTSLMLLFVFASGISHAKKTPLFLSVKLNHFRKLVIKGNVSVVLIQRNEPGIIYADDNSGRAKVHQQGEYIKITGDGNEGCKLIVYTNDLYRVEAEGHASIKTEGPVSFKLLQVMLRDHAAADINIKAEALRTQVSSYATLKLQGIVNHHFHYTDGTANVAMNNLIALQTESKLVSNDRLTTPDSSNSFLSLNIWRSSISAPYWYNTAFFTATFEA